MVFKWLAKHGFVYAEFDGCVYGLVAEKGPVAGMPIKKPWRVACSPGSSLPSYLNQRCDGSHEHTPCAGVNTVATQGYTDDICKLIHKSISADIRKVLNTADDVEPQITCVSTNVEQEGLTGSHETPGLPACVALCLGGSQNDGTEEEGNNAFASCTVAPTGVATDGDDKEHPGRIMFKFVLLVF